MKLHSCPSKFEYSRWEITLGGGNGFGAGGGLKIFHSFIKSLRLMEIK